MDNQQTQLDDFIEIDIKVLKPNQTSRPPSTETTQYQSVRDLFETTLNESFKDYQELKRYGIDAYHLQVGDRIKIHPSKWTTGFQEHYEQETVNEEYQPKYEIINIRIEYYTENPNTESKLPLIKLLIELRKV